MDEIITPDLIEQLNTILIDLGLYRDIASIICSYKWTYTSVETLFKLDGKHREECAGNVIFYRNTDLLYAFFEFNGCIIEQDQIFHIKPLNKYAIPCAFSFVFQYDNDIYLYSNLNLYKFIFDKIAGTYDLILHLCYEPTEELSLTTTVKMSIDYVMTTMLDCVIIYDKTATNIYVIHAKTLMNGSHVLTRLNVIECNETKEPSLSEMKDITNYTTRHTDICFINSDTEVFMIERKEDQFYKYKLDIKHFAQTMKETGIVYPYIETKTNYLPHYQDGLLQIEHDGDFTGKYHEKDLIIGNTEDYEKKTFLIMRLKK